MGQGWWPKAFALTSKSLQIPLRIADPHRICAKFYIGMWKCLQSKNTACFQNGKSGAHYPCKSSCHFSFPSDQMQAADLHSETSTFWFPEWEAAVYMGLLEQVSEWKCRVATGSLGVENTCPSLSSIIHDIFSAQTTNASQIVSMRKMCC